MFKAMGGAAGTKRDRHAHAARSPGLPQGRRRDPSCSQLAWGLRKAVLSGVRAQTRGGVARASPQIPTRARWACAAGASPCGPGLSIRPSVLLQTLGGSRSVAPPGGEPWPVLLF